MNRFEGAMVASLSFIPGVTLSLMLRSTRLPFFDWGSRYRDSWIICQSSVISSTNMSSTYMATDFRKPRPSGVV